MLGINNFLNSKILTTPKYNLSFKSVPDDAIPEEEATPEKPKSEAYLRYERFLIERQKKRDYYAPMKKVNREFKLETSDFYDWCPPGKLLQFSIDLEKLDTRTPRDKATLIIYCGLEKGEPKTLKETAKYFGLSSCELSPSVQIVMDKYDLRFYRKECFKKLGKEIPDSEKTQEERENELYEKRFAALPKKAQKLLKRDLKDSLFATEYGEEFAGSLKRIFIRAKLTPLETSALLFYYGVFEPPKEKKEIYEIYGGHTKSAQQLGNAIKKVEKASLLMYKRLEKFRDKYSDNYF